jgi:hypothetical protein
MTMRTTLSSVTPLGDAPTAYAGRREGGATGALIRFSIDATWFMRRPSVNPASAGLGRTDPPLVETLPADQWRRVTPAPTRFIGLLKSSAP